MPGTDRFLCGDRVYHSRRDEYGTFEGPTVDKDTVWVKFDGGESEKVSRHLLVKDLATALRRSVIDARQRRLQSMAELLHDADPDCDHDIVDGDNGSGIKCAECPGWHCA